MPRAVMADALGALDNYSLRQFDPGPPPAGWVQVSVRAAGVSFVDVLNATGRYQSRARVPFIPGSEFAGVIESLGEGVSGLSRGERVLGTTWGGAFADLVNVPAGNVDPVPPGMAFTQAAVFRVSAATARHALVDRGRLAAGEMLLVLGAGGATGYAAVQLGRHLGARVIASASTAEGRALALEGGADCAVDTAAPDWRERVEAAAGGTVDAVFDPVGGELTERAFRCLGWDGRHLVVGFTGGIPKLPANLALLKSASLVGVNLQQFALARPEQARDNAARVLELAGQGLLQPAVAQVLPLEDFAAAMAAVSAGGRAGRIVLTMQ